MKIILCLALSFISLEGNCQVIQNSGTSGIANGQAAGKLADPTYLTNLINRPVTLFPDDVSGSPYLTEEYKQAFVQQKDGYTQKDVPVRFNLYRNEFEFKQAGIVNVLALPQSIIYLDRPFDSSSIRIFVSGYPFLSNLTDESIYELLAKGKKAHLLKYIEQKLEEVKTVGVFGKKALVSYASYYLFNTSTRKLVKIKLDKKSIIEQFLLDAARIEQHIQRKKLNLKNESDLSELITTLNNESL